MWIIIAMWAVCTSSLSLGTTASHSSHSNYQNSETPDPAQYGGSQKGPVSLTDPRWNELKSEGTNFLYGQDMAGRNGGYFSLDSFPESDSVSLPRNMFGYKSTGSSESARNFGEGNINLLEDDEARKNKRESHSLSIVNPLDVLRQRLMLEMARRRMKENQEQIRENEVILKNLGKRSSPSIRIDENTDSKGGSGDRTKQDYLRSLQVSDSEDFEV